MSTTFFSFDLDSKRSAIKVKAAVEYEWNSLFTQQSILKSHNKLSIYKGKKAFDLLGFYNSLKFIVSEHFIKVLESNQVTGWDCFPVEIEGIETAYFVFFPTSIAGPILNPDTSPFATVTFDISTWDGSDIFSLEKTTLHACVPRVKALFEEAKISNIDIEPL